jgi:hypothetical protein
LEGHGDQSYETNRTRLALECPKDDRGTSPQHCRHVRAVLNHDADHENTRTKTPSGCSELFCSHSTFQGLTAALSILQSGFIRTTSLNSHQGQREYRQARSRPAASCFSKRVESASGSLRDKSDVRGVRLAQRQSQTQAGRRSENVGLCAALSDKRDLVLLSGWRQCSERVSATPLPQISQSPKWPGTHDSPDTEQPNSSENWAAVVRAVERFDANRSSAFKPRRRSANDTRSGPQPRSDAARLLCPRLPSSISASLPSTSFVFRAFVIRQNSSSSYHSTIPTPHPGLSTISFASASLQYQDCGTTEHIDPIVAASCIILRDPFSQGSFCDLAISAPLYSSYTNIASYRHASSQVHPRRQARQDGAYSRREPGEVCFTVCSLQDSMLTPF